MEKFAKCFDCIYSRFPDNRTCCFCQNTFYTVAYGTTIYTNIDGHHIVFCSLNCKISYSLSKNILISENHWDENCKDLIFYEGS